MSYWDDFFRGVSVEFRYGAGVLWQRSGRARSERGVLDCYGVLAITSSGFRIAGQGTI